MEYVYNDIINPVDDFLNRLICWNDKKNISTIVVIPPNGGNNSSRWYTYVRGKL